MRDDIFKYLRKKILNNSEISYDIDSQNENLICKIKSLGFEETITLPLMDDVFGIDVIRGLMIDKLVENSDYLKKLGQIETRISNLKSLLD